MTAANLASAVNTSVHSGFAGTAVLQDARNFLSRVVEWDGSAYVNLHYFAQKPGYDRRIMRGAAVQSPEGAIKQLVYLASQPHVQDIYFCTSTQATCEEKKTKGGRPFKSAKRTRENAVRLKALFLDIDVGKAGGYETTADAVAALKKLCLDTRLPAPTALVASGTGGFYVYWILERSLSVAEWQPLADAMVAAGKASGLLFDSQCTVDAVRILRVPQTRNFKTNPPSSVMLKSLQEGDVPNDVIERALARFKTSACVLRYRANDNFLPADFGPPPRGITADMLAVNDEFSAGIERGTSERDINAVATQCGFVRDTLADGGKDNPNPLWFLSLRLALFCNEPDDTGHALSLGHHGYHPEETQGELDRLRAERERNPKIGWPSCAAICSAGASQCANCSHKDEGRSPLNFVGTNSLPLRVTPSVGGTEISILPECRSGYASARNTLVQAGIQFAYDTLHDRLLINGEQLTDDMVSNLCDFVIEKTNKDPGIEQTYRAIRSLCVAGSFNPVVDYLQGLHWNHAPRLDTWLIDYAGAEDTPLNRAIGRKFLIGMVRRVLHPGCKFDTALILEGPQGIGKSTLATVLAGESENFSDTDPTHLNSKEQMELVRGKWVVELPELSGMRRADVSALKAFMSRTTDRGRPAYGRAVIDQPRTCVFVGTVNDKSYLQDDTGNRRFWPVEVFKIDLLGLRNARDQLFAEAAKAVAEGESAALPSALWEAATEQQEMRRTEDPWAETLAAMPGKTITHNGLPELFIPNVEIWAALQVSADKRTSGMAGRIGKIMGALGWERARIKLGGNAERGFTRPAISNATP
ncbi:hypothetical protein AMST5_03054 [freshwater sediment metagenome]|uniref:Virulence-associated protein E-like domain-containing protein n=1 Tax=freshwater sediment metagenome TaxID=556182 RepID=A0AA48M356_9ZZZZ